MRKDGITLQAHFARAVTTVDGGWRISFDVSQDEAKAVLQLSALRDSILLQLAVLPILDAPEIIPNYDSSPDWEGA